MYTKYKISTADRAIITGYLRNYSAYRQAVFHEAGTNNAAPTLKYKIVQAIESARGQIGDNIILTSNQREWLKSAVWASCIEPKWNTYEQAIARHPIPICRRDFFRQKALFLNRIKENIGL